MKRGEMTFSRALFVPEVVEDNAQVSGVLLSVPNQQLLSNSYGLTAAVQNPSSVLEGHQILLFFTTSTVHIPEKREGETEKDLRAVRG
jgi:Fic family protein